MHNHSGSIRLISSVQHHRPLSPHQGAWRHVWRQQNGTQLAQVLPQWQIVLHQNHNHEWNWRQSKFMPWPVTIFTVHYSNRWDDIYFWHRISLICHDICQRYLNIKIISCIGRCHSVDCVEPIKTKPVEVGILVVCHDLLYTSCWAQRISSDGWRYYSSLISQTNGRLLQ